MGNESGRTVAMGVSLTRREVEVAGLVAEGKTSAQIAAQLFVHPRTAEFHTNNLLVKFGVRSRALMASKLLAWERARHVELGVKSWREGDYVVTYLPASTSTAAQPGTPR